MQEYYAPQPIAPRPEQHSAPQEQWEILDTDLKLILGRVNDFQKHYEHFQGTKGILDIMLNLLSSSQAIIENREVFKNNQRSYVAARESVDALQGYIRLLDRYPAFLSSETTGQGNSFPDIWETAMEKAAKHEIRSSYRYYVNEAARRLQG